jgi:molybdenum cofactor cytidylyltransferase
LNARPSLGEALRLDSSEIVAFVGGGGKTCLLQWLADDLSASGRRVVATTTTGMYLHQLERWGPVLLEREPAHLVSRVRACFGTDGRVVAVATGLASVAAGSSTIDAPALTSSALSPIARPVDPASSKVGGVPTELPVMVGRAADADVVVEADGSKGKSLKAFAEHEPAMPAGVTTIVQVAGVDVIGKPLVDEFVHRPDLVARMTGAAPGEPVTSDVFAACLSGQLTELRNRWPKARVMTFLNKADDAVHEELARRAGLRLLAAPAAPDRVLAGSCRDRRFMPVAPAISAIVLAAGCGARMGRPKLLLSLAGRPLVDYAVEAATSSWVAETIVVVGCEAERLEEALAGKRVRIVRNDAYATGMSSSMRVGLAAASRSAAMAGPSLRRAPEPAVEPALEAVVFLLGDQPFVTGRLVDLVIAEFLRTRAAIVRPVLDGLPRHPVLVASSLFAELLEQDGDLGARAVIQRHPADVALVPIADRLAALDVDTSEEYEMVAANVPPGSGE